MWRRRTSVRTRMLRPAGGARVASASEALTGRAGATSAGAASSGEAVVNDVVADGMADDACELPGSGACEEKQRPKRNEVVVNDVVADGMAADPCELVGSGGSEEKQRPKWNEAVVNGDGSNEQQNGTKMMEGIEKTLSCKQQNKVNTSEVVSQYNEPKKAQTIEVFPYDYVCTKEDESIIENIASQPWNKILVDIEGAFCTREILECLFNGTSHVEGDVLSPYIHLLRAEEHLQYREGGKVFLENTYISSILKRDGKLNENLISVDNDTIDTRVVNYLDHDLVFFPINIEKFHWYLGVVNARECELHVLDSLGEGVNPRIDLAETILGLQRQISIVANKIELKNDKWRDLQVTEWPIVEKVTSPMQTDG